MTRDQYLLTIRPIIDLAEANTAIEKFQNNTLRPILKFQNDLIIQILQENKVLFNANFFSMKPTEKRMVIEKLYQKDLSFRQLNIGIVVGLFTLEEKKFFQEHKQECAKRIISMIIERIHSQV